MAVKPCKECGGPLSDKADSCPRCGAKVKKMGMFSKIILGFFAFFVICGVIGSLASNNSSNKNTANASNASAENAEPAATLQAEVPQEPKNWYYDSKKDELHGTTTKFAGTESLNSANFDFPYEGGSKLYLTVRKNHDGADVYITISKGQFVCGIVDGCDVAFKFDDGQIMNITMVEPDSHNSDMLFVRLDSTEQKIINKLQTSKKLIIAPKFYQHGDVQFKFDVSNYKAI